MVDASLGVVAPSLEDAPLRGCRAALKIRERIATKATDLEMKHGLRPRMRIGINAGPIIVGKEREAVKASGSSDVQAALCALPRGRSPRLRGTNESDRWMHLEAQTHSARSARARLPAAKRLPVRQRYASCSGAESRCYSICCPLLLSMYATLCGDAVEVSCSASGAPRANELAE